MRITCLFIQRKESYRGEYGPELRAAADEYTMDENPEYFPEQVEKELKAVGNEVENHVIVEIEVDENSLMRLLRPSTVKLKGKLITDSVAPAQE